MNAPRVWPNSSLSSRLGDSAPALIATIGLCARWLCEWMSLASSSLPVPVSPWISTVAVDAAARTPLWISEFITPLLLRMSCCLTS